MTSVAFAIRYEFRVLKVQAGPVAPGGARWNLYRQDRPLDDFHPLLQTLLVPRGARGVTVEVQAWAREAGYRSGSGMDLRAAEPFKSRSPEEPEPHVPGQARWRM